jgi:predicted aspartyl protease
MNTIVLSLASLLLTTTPEVTPPVSTYTLTVALFNDARVSPAVLAGAQESVSQAGFASHSELPLLLASGYLIQVEGRIGTRTNLKFILDTGASVTIVDQRIADKLKLDRHPSQSFNFDRVLNWDAATLPELQFGPVHVTNIAVYIGRLSDYSEFAKNEDGIIGMDLLKFTNFSIDFDTRKITLYPSTQKVSVVPGDPLLQCPVLEVQVQGHSVRLILDTGLSGIILYEERLRRRVPGFRTAGHVADVTVGGRLQAKQATIPDVLVGKANRDVTALLVASPAPEMLPGIDGIIGIGALKAHHINFDFSARTVRWD